MRKNPAINDTKKQIDTIKKSSNVLSPRAYKYSP